MEVPFKYGTCSLYLSPFWVRLPSDPEVELQLIPLSHSSINSSRELAYLNHNSEDFLYLETVKSLLQKQAISSRNALGFPSVKELIEQLPREDAQFIHRKLLDISVVTSEQVEAADLLLEIQLSPSFSEDSWNCKTCQEKKLDYARGCGYLPEDKRDPNPMLPRVNGIKFKQCPMSTLDAFASNQLGLAYSMFDAGFLPEPGGLGNQTDWFVRMSLLYKRKLAQAERRAMEAHKK